MKALKITISGSYRGRDKDTHDFNGITGVVPYNSNPDIVSAHVRRRYAPMWIANSPKHSSAAVGSIRECYIDGIEEVEHDFSFLGKSITEMTQEEVQDLATLKDLREIPLWRKSSTRRLHDVAYAVYANEVLREDHNYREEGFNSYSLPPIVVGDARPRAADVGISNEELLDIVAKGNKDNYLKDNLDKKDLKRK